jgi:farnesyl diphosphate synthase
MRYSLLSSSAKRIRPILVYATGEMMHAPLPILDIFAASIELMHIASLVHDDLPALDNDDMRRGQRSTHKAFGEATAILAGDAMQVLAFELLTEFHDQSLTPALQVKSVHVLAKAFGINGVMTGQILDLNERWKTITLETLNTIYQLKTASLLNAALHLGAIAANCQDSAIFDCLTQFAENIGLAYQIQDDILDIGADQGHKQTGPITYPSLIGLDKSKDKVKSLYERALSVLQALPYDVSLLEAIAKRMIFRTY